MILPSVWHTVQATDERERERDDTHSSRSSSHHCVHCLPCKLQNRLARLCTYIPAVCGSCYVKGTDNRFFRYIFFSSIKKLTNQCPIKQWQREKTPWIIGIFCRWSLTRNATHVVNNGQQTCGVCARFNWDIAHVAYVRGCSVLFFWRPWRHRCFPESTPFTVQ